MRLHCRPGVALLALAGLIVSVIAAQSQPSVAGDYAGVLAGALHLKLHIKAAADGTLNGTLDSPDQGANGIPCADFHLEGNSFSFRVPAVNGTWKGSVGADGSLTGTWNQGSPMALNFARDTFVPAEKPSAVDGVWLGAAQAAARSPRAQIKVKSDRSGQEFCTFTSLDQAGAEWECAKVTLNGAGFSFEVPQAHGRWAGKLSPDNQTLTGTWTQGASFALDFSRQTAAVAVPLIAYDTVMPLRGAHIRQRLIGEAPVSLAR